jgi:hypothetical protein
VYCGQPEPLDTLLPQCQQSNLAYLLVLSFFLFITLGQSLGIFGDGWVVLKVGLGGRLFLVWSVGRKKKFDPKEVNSETERILHTTQILGQLGSHMEMILLSGINNMSSLTMRNKCLSILNSLISRTFFKWKPALKVQFCLHATGLLWTIYFLGEEIGDLGESKKDESWPRTHTIPCSPCWCFLRCPGWNSFPWSPAHLPQAMPHMQRRMWR